MRTRLTRVIVAVALFHTVSDCLSIAQTAQEQLNAIGRETRKQGKRPARATLVWWLPAEFWRATWTAAGTIPADKVQEMVAAILEVNVIAVLDGKFQGSGAVNYLPETDLRKNLSASDTEGKPLALIPEDNQTDAIKDLLAKMNPVFPKLMGDVGKHVSVFVFEGKDGNGSRRIDPTKPGSFVVRLSGEEFRWRLPLGSLLPSKTCPKCNDTFSGNYAFCPFDATPLKEAAAKNE